MAHSYVHYRIYAPYVLEGVRCAEEGDLRLVDEEEVAAWQVGRLEVFFEGSWGQVCAANFAAADADVACRQLGFGAGSVGPNSANGAPAMDDRLVFPVVALTTPGCNGTEDSLLDCGPFTGHTTRFTDRDCFGDNDPGLTLACVATPEEGAHFFFIASVAKQVQLHLELKNPHQVYDRDFVC